MRIIVLLMALIISSCGAHHIGKHTILTDKAPKPIGPYCQAIVAGKLIFVSGQIAINPSTGDMIGGDIKDEAKQVLDNIGAVLESAGADFSSIVKTTIYLKDISDFKAVNEVYSSFFISDFPARETVGVASLPKNARVEISVIAVKK